MNRPSHTRRALAIVFVCTEWLLLIYLLLACLQPVLLRHESLTPIPSLNLIDGSWILDTSYKAGGGIWFGRDVAFTYGPLFQWLSSAPARCIGLSTGAIFATWYTLPFCIIVIATFLTARLLLPGAAAWRRTLLVLLGVVYWSPPDLRVSLCLLAFAAFVRLIGAAPADRRSIVLAAVAAAAICVAAFLLSADTGLYTTAALGLCLVASAVTVRPAADTVKFALIVAAAFVLFVLMTNDALASLLDFRFWRSSLTLVANYRWFEPLAMTKADKRLVLAILALGIAVFALAWRWRTSGGTWTRRPSFLLAGFCFAVLFMQSALVRSDHGHVLMGIYPVVFLCGAIALDRFDSRVLSFALPAAAVLATVTIASAYPLFRPDDIVVRAQQVFHPLLACPGNLQEFDRACLSPDDAELLRKASSYVDAATRPGDTIAVFPYETAFGLAARRQVAGGVLQSYLVNGDYLTSLDLDGLRRSNPPLALYFPDGALSVRVDSIPNLTRSPEVWFYLVQHYRAAGTPAFGVLGLVRDESRATRVSLTTDTLHGPVEPARVNRRSAWIDVPIKRWPDAGADFLKVRLRVNYPPWWRLRKPSKLTLKLTFADGTDKSMEFVLEPNRSTDIWFYPWEDKTMGSYFSDNPGTARPGERPALTEAKLLVSPIDWISVVPSSVSIESVEAVRLTIH